MKKFSLTTAFAIITILGFSQWSKDTTVRNPICTADQSQNNPSMCSDGHHGAIIAWDDYRVSGGNRVWKFYLQRVDSNGVNKWADNGVEVPINQANGGTAVSRIIVSDNQGGAIMFYATSIIGGANNIYAQKIDSNGNLKWGPTGVAICTSQDSRMRSLEYAVTNQAAPDGNGGAFVTWQGYGPFCNLAQHVDKNGNIQWAANGLRLTSADSTNGYTSFIVNTGNGTAAVGFAYSGGGNTRLYMNRIAADGSSVWAKPVIIADAYTDYISSTGAFLYYDSISAQKSIVLAWTDIRNQATNGADVYAQKVDVDGNLLWPANGVMVSATPADDDNTDILPDGTGGFFMAYNSSEVRLQHVTSTGQLLWGANGIKATNANGYTQDPVMVNDGATGFIAMWLGNTGLVAQHFTASGTPLWRAYGIPVIAVPISINHSATPLVTSNDGSAIAAWTTYASAAHIYAAKVGGTDGLLPVNFISFDASLQKNTTQLQWVTAQQVTGNYFDVERSENGRLFTRLFTVPVITTNAASHTYNATDASPLEGVSYYRIKEVDKNGNISFSHVVAVDAEGLNSATAYPTPAHNTVFVNIKTVAQTTVLNMYDTQGKLVDQKHVLLKNGNNMVRWDVNRLSPGLYFIRGGKTGMEVTIIKQ